MKNDKVRVRAKCQLPCKELGSAPWIFVTPSTCVLQVQGLKLVTHLPWQLC